MSFQKDIAAEDTQHTSGDGGGDRERVLALSSACAGNSWTAGCLVLSGLLPAQIIFGKIAEKIRKWFLLCGGWSHLVFGESEDVFSGRAWTVYMVFF